MSEDNFVDRSRDKNAVLVDLMKSWNRLGRRSEEHDDAWVKDLGEFLNQIVQSRIDRVEKWLSVNTVRYPPTHAGIQDLKRAANSMFIELKANVQLCGLQCTSCHLSCILVRHHDAKHNCGTSHQCVQLCQFDDHTEGEPCGLLQVISSLIQYFIFTSVLQSWTSRTACVRLSWNAEMSNER